MPKSLTFRVFFKDKGSEKFEQGSDLYNKTLSILSNRAIKRRLKVRKEENLITIDDAPVEQKYIDEILKLDVKLLLTLRWRNYCVFECDSVNYNEIVEEISGFDFVLNVQSTGEYIFEPQTIIKTDKHKREFDKKNLYTISSLDDCGDFSYGESYLQNSLINADKLHKLGITGDSVLIGFLDSGFRWRTHNAMKNADVRAEYDFIQLDSVTSNEKDDIAGQDGHGTLTFSTICGMLPDKLIGISPTSSFILCKTESIPHEIKLEEDNYAAAIEWIEALGADISTSSLAYKTFNNPDSGYVFEDFDGKTTTTAVALNNAVSRGMVCVTAAANTGPAPETIYTPGDADSAITCAAVKIDNNMIVPADFSSRGPTADLEIKPDIAALGVQVVSAGRKDSVDLIKANGTSLSTPIVAGATSLLLSCFPELTTWEVRSLIYSTASKYPEKDNTTGYGLLDIFAAMHKAGTIISPPVIYSVKNYIRILFHIVPDSYLSENPELFVITGGVEKTYTMYATGKEYQYAADINKDDIIWGNAKAQLKVNTSLSERKYPFRSEYFAFTAESERIPCGIDKNKLPKFETDRNLFIYPSIIYNNTGTIKLTYELRQYGSINISVYTVDGKKLFEENIPEREAGIITKEIPVNGYYSGSYFLVVMSGATRDVEKFLIIR
jgi:hypothetical protein